MTVATGPGPRWLRTACAVLAALYFVALVKHPPQWPGLHAAGFFTESTCLFPRANMYASEYRLDAWSCSAKKWQPLDPRAYFPIEADDKESRFQRFGYFYHRNRTAMIALDDWIYARHDGADDGVTGAIGGIRLYRWSRPIPPPGESVERRVYDPLAPVPMTERKDLFYTKAGERKSRCGI